jgi:hypothetical protein
MKLAISAHTRNRRLARLLATGGATTSWIAADRRSPKTSWRPALTPRPRPAIPHDDKVAAVRVVFGALTGRGWTEDATRRRPRPVDRGRRSYPFDGPGDDNSGQQNWLERFYEQIIDVLAPERQRATRPDPSTPGVEQLNRTRPGTAWTFEPSITCLHPPRRHWSSPAAVRPSPRRDWYDPHGKVLMFVVRPTLFFGACSCRCSRASSGSSSSTSCSITAGAREWLCCS